MRVSCSKHFSLRPVARLTFPYASSLLLRHMRTRFSVFLITLSGLILEVGLTRIYSASIWYHFAFVAISVALLGWGLGGFTVHLWKGARRAKGEGERAESRGRQAE